MSDENTDQLDKQPGYVPMNVRKQAAELSTAEKEAGDYVPKSELRELVEKFRDSDYAHSHDYYAQIGLCIAADELEELL